MEKFCIDCGNLDHPKTVNKGSVGIEAALLFISVIGAVLNLFFGAILFLVFVVYCVWRLASKHQICLSCGNRNIIPPDSPKARILISEMYKANH